MPALLSYGDQAFWVSNSTKDLLYEVAVAVAEREDPAAYHRLIEDGRLLGCYGVSGLGFELEAFEEAFGGREAWQKAIAKQPDAVGALCPTSACAQHVAKLFAWIWSLLSGGRCNDAAGAHPVFDNMPEIPGAEVVSLSSERCSEGRSDERAADNTDPGPLTKVLFGIGLGVFLGTVVGVANMLLGLANNWLTIPAWTISGALLGSAHPMVEALLDAIGRKSGR
jgi:hypothetical protein